MTLLPTPVISKQVLRGKGNIYIKKKKKNLSINAWKWSFPDTNIN